VECTALPTANTYLTALTPASKPGPNGNTTDAIDFYARNSGTGWQVGVRTTGVSASFASPVLAINTTYLVVLEYTFGGTAQLYLNPVAGDPQPGANVTLTPSAYVTDVSDVGFKAQTATTIGSYVFDNMMVGTSWSDVTPINAVPEPGTLALAGLGALGLVFARRMRR
jgi:hypothetical protein